MELIPGLNSDALKVLLIIAATMLTLAVSVIGYFLAKRDKAITATTDNLASVVNQLKEVVNGLTIQYNIRQPIIDDMLKGHDESIKILMDTHSGNVEWKRNIAEQVSKYIKEINELKQLIAQQNAVIVKLKTEHEMGLCKIKKNES